MILIFLWTSQMNSGWIHPKVPPQNDTPANEDAVIAARGAKDDPHPLRLVYEIQQRAARSSTSAHGSKVCTLCGQVLRIQ